jgi:hypothetical protein
VPAGAAQSPPGKGGGVSPVAPDPGDGGVEGGAGPGGGPGVGVGVSPQPRPRAGSWDRPLGEGSQPDLPYLQLEASLRPCSPDLPVL